MRRVPAALCLGFLALALAAPAAEASLRPVEGAGMGDRWSRYLATGALREPSRTFPHEHCFRRAAAAHGLPLTLLLAAVHAMEQALAEFAAGRVPQAGLADFAHLQAIVGFPEYYELEKKYAGG